VPDARDALVIVGTLAVAVGVGLWFWPAGFVVVGAMMVYLGLTWK